MSDYVSAETIAEEIDVTPKTVRDWLRTGELVGIKVGNSWRIHRADFDRYIDGQRLDALLKKATAKHPTIDWEQGQCTECGDHMAKPVEGSRAWVCSTSCKTSHDAKWATVVDRNSDEYAFQFQILCAVVQLVFNADTGHTHVVA